MKSSTNTPWIAAVALCSVATGSICAQQANVGWTDYLGGPGSAHYSPLKQITPENVSKLETAWSYESGEGFYNFSPLVIDDIAYVAAKQGSLVAVNATTGKELWVHSFTGSGKGGGLGNQRGANYWESKDRKDRRLFIVSGGYLHALNAQTGNLIDNFADHGKLDLKIGIDRAPIPLAPRTPGRIFEDLLILGSFTGEGYLAPPGDIRAFNVKTGKLVWVFHTIPRPGEFGYDTWPKDAYKYLGGVDVWGETTVDEKRGIVYLPVASAKYELYGGDRPGNNLYADSILALDARTGKYLWHFQTIHHDIWDYDLSAAPQLATIQHDGKTLDVVAVASKNGFLYVFDRVTGKPVWPIEERPVPKSDVPGEWTSPTQPFPTVVPPFARQGMKPDDMYDGFMTPEEKVHWTERLKNARTGLYTPPGLVDTILLPSVNGGAFYFSTGSDSAHGIVFVQSKDVPSIIKMVPAGESTAANSGATIPTRPRRARSGGGGFGFGPQAMAARAGRAVYDQSCQACHGPDLKGDRGPQIDNAVARLGADEVSNIISKGRGGMPSFPTMSETYKKSLLTFLSNPDLAPPGSAIHPGDLAARDEPNYPAYVSPPPSRYKTGYGSEGYVIKPPWSTLTAYDLNTGKIMWQTPYGDLPQAGPSDKLRGNVSPRGSFVVTGGGLVLFASNDAKLYVLDEHTGKVIYTKELPNGANAVPAVYEVNGREYVLLSLVGGTGFPPGTHMPPGGVNPPNGPKSYIALALPKQ